MRNSPPNGVALMHISRTGMVFAAASMVFAGALFVTPQPLKALPLAPAPLLDSPLTEVQYNNRGVPGRVSAGRPIARPGVRPGVRPGRPVGVAPGFRPGRPGVVAPGFRPGRPVAVAPGFRPGVRPPAYRPGRPVVRPGVRPGYVYWNRPYRWRPGGAIAAGAAIGFIGAIAAAQYYGQPPAPGLCWYYTNPSRTAGFWDECPY